MSNDDFWRNVLPPERYLGMVQLFGRPSDTLAEINQITAPDPNAYSEPNDIINRFLGRS